VSAEERLLQRMEPIEEALAQALSDAAGEKMGFILLVVPVGRVAEKHVIASNILEQPAIAEYLRNAAEAVRKQEVSLGEQTLQ
jgi:hypothetical protein